MVNLGRLSVFAAAVLLTGCVADPSAQQYPGYAPAYGYSYNPYYRPTPYYTQPYYQQPQTYYYRPTPTPAPAPAPAPEPQAEAPAAPEASGGSGGWLIPGAHAAPMHPDPPPAPVPADNSCGWWRLSNLWGCTSP
jgi:hypothetical protein